MENSLVKLKTTLREANSSTTSPRVAVFTALANRGPLSMGDLARALAPEVDRATVYRTVELFERLGIINRIWHGFKNQVELSEIFTPHHHHAQCLNCGKTTDVASSDLEAALAALTKRHDFLALNHSVEIRGYCSECQS